MYLVNIYQEGEINEFPPVYASDSAQHALDAARTAMSNDQTLYKVIIQEIVCNSYYNRLSFSQKNQAFKAMKIRGIWEENFSDGFLAKFPLLA